MPPDRKSAMTYSEEYASTLRKLHDEEESFGGGSQAHIVAQLIRALKVKNLSDYGAGKKRLEYRLTHEFGIRISYSGYDPAYPEYGDPEPADLVCCIEVLEHVEPDLIDMVLAQLQKITIGFGFFTVHTSDSGKFLIDGRNAHILQRPISWWLPKISLYFEVQWLNKTGPDSFAILVTPKDSPLLRLNTLELTHTDSFRHHLKRFVTDCVIEFRRRIRRRKWRP